MYALPKFKQLPPMHGGYSQDLLYVATLCINRTNLIRPGRKPDAAIPNLKDYLGLRVVTMHMRRQMVIGMDSESDTIEGYRAQRLLLRVPGSTLAKRSAIARENKR
jgi:hypothetical protein